MVVRGSRQLDPPRPSEPGQFRDKPAEDVFLLLQACVPRFGYIIDRRKKGLQGSCLDFGRAAFARGERAEKSGLAFGQARRVLFQGGLDGIDGPAFGVIEDLFNQAGNHVEGAGISRLLRQGKHLVVIFHVVVDPGKDVGERPGPAVDRLMEMPEDGDPHPQNPSSETI